MKVVVQRVKSASVIVDGQIRKSINKGICILVGFKHDDTQKDIDYMANKVLNLRLFDDEVKERKWDLNVKQKNYEVLCLSQFTLYSKLKGNKLDFHNAMSTHESEKIYHQFVDKIKNLYKPDLVQDGLFGLYRIIKLENDGPVTILLDSPNEKVSSSEKFQ